MVQFGENAGARHVRVFSVVNNLLRKNIDPSERQRKDRQILGVFGLSWALFQSAMPKQVTDTCEVALEASGMPRMTYSNDPSSI
jgi:hypothetical protein